MNLFNKFTAGLTAAAVVVMTIAPVAQFNFANANSEENQLAYERALDNGLTSKQTYSAFMPEASLTREAAAKFFVAGAEALGLEGSSDQECDYSDLATADQTLVDYINDGCAMGFFKAQDKFNPKATMTREQMELVVARMVYGMDEVATYADDEGMSEYAAARAMLMDDEIVQVEIAGASAAKRLHLILMLFRLSDMEVVVDPTDPTVPSTGTVTTGTTVEVKAGNLDVSLNASSPTNGSSIPYNGVVSFGKVDLQAGSSDVSVNSIKMKRTGLGQSSDISRVYFERNGVRISSRANVNSDNEVITAFTPALVVKAGSKETIDLVVEMTGNVLALGGEHALNSLVIDSSALTTNGSFATPMLRTSNYAVRQATFTSQNVTTNYNGNETQTELGKFQLQNGGGSQVIDLNLRAITLRNVGNSSATSLSNIGLYRGGVKVSTDVILNGRDVTFAVNDTVKDAQSAVYTILWTVNNVDNAGGDTYKFILRQSSDLSIVESTTSYRANIVIASNTNNDSNLTAGVYTVQGGELRFAQDSTALSQLSASQGATHVTLMKGTVTTKQAILLEDPTLSILLGSSAVSSFATKYTLVIGNSTFSWTPVSGASTALFDGSVTINGSANVELYADVRSNAVTSTSVKFGNLSSSSFARKEYISTQNNVTSAVGTIAGRIVTVNNSVLDVSRSDGLTNVKSTNNASNKLLYAVKLTNSQDNDIKVGAITLSPTSGSFNNDVSVDLVVGGAIAASRTLNGDTTFNGLNIIVKKNTPVELQFRGNFLSTATAGEATQFAVKFNAGDAIDNVTANNVSVGNVPALTALATSTTTTIIGGGSVQVTSNASATPAKWFITPTASSTQYLGSINVQAVDDDLELKGLYITLVGSGTYSTQVGNQISNLVIKDQTNATVATESSRWGTNNEIVKFNNFVASTLIPVGVKKFDIYGTVNNVTTAANAGDFKLVIATGYTDVQYPEIYSGMRLLSVNAGTYVTASSVTSTSIGNTYSVISSFPKFASSSVSSSNTDIANFTVTNQSSTNIVKLNSINYTAQSSTFATEWVGKTVNIELNGSVVATAMVAANGTLTLTNPVSINPNSSVTFNVKMDVTTPFDPQPASGTRVRTFSITDASFDQVFSDGTSATIASVSTNLTSVGLSISQNYTY